MLRDIAFLAIGVVALYFGAEWLVRGSAGIARSFGVSALVVGLTVVAIGTSMPELVVSAGAALEGKSDIALGNVVGSNICNIGIILGLTAIISPPRVERGMILRELPVLFLATAAVPVFLVDGLLGRIEGALLLAGALAFIYFLIATSRRGALEHSVEDEAEILEELEERVLHHIDISPRARLKLGAIGLVGLVVLVLGGKLFVDGAVGIASRVGMSERVIGLTVVAVGTSLPELAASLVAALRGHSDIAVGNVVGSNIFNLLLILGGAALISPIAGSLDVYVLDFAAVGVMTLLAVVFLRTERVIRRWEGVLLAVIYVGYLAALVAGR
jgi:cation:H+ antiporter